jgi:hypothetical protein
MRGNSSVEFRQRGAAATSFFFALALLCAVVATATRTHARQQPEPAPQQQSTSQQTPPQQMPPQQPPASQQPGAQASPTPVASLAARVGASPSPTPERDPAMTDTPPVVTKHELRVGGRTLRYTVTTGIMPLRNTATGETEARIFYMAYTLDGVADVLLQRRPRLRLGLAAHGRARAEARADDGRRTDAAAAVSTG